ncbi:MAG: acyl-CoA desaturase [Zavarzinella sp.]
MLSLDVPSVVPVVTDTTEESTNQSIASHAAQSPRKLPKFPKDDGFYAALKQKADVYFASTGKSRRGPLAMYAKAATILLWWAASYIALVFFCQSIWLAIPLALSLALAMTAVCFSIQHDGGHSAFSNKRWMNRLAASTLDMVGASSYLWHTKHAILHHTYVNIDKHDTDIDVGTLARFCYHQPRRWFHRFQHVYLWMLYGLMGIRWHLFADFKEIAVGKIGEHPIPRPKFWDMVIFYTGKAVSFTLLLALPMFFHSWWLVLLFYVGVVGMMGMIMSVVFQLAHCVGEADFPLPETESNRMDQTWSIHQIQTTVDFAQTSRIVTWYCGGLNFQIEHHLFPHISHVHYPALSKLVRETCEEHGINYMVHPTFMDGVRSHYRYLRDLGKYTHEADKNSSTAPTTAA